MDAKLKFLILGLLPRPVRRRIMVARYVEEVRQTGEAELLALRDLVKTNDMTIDVGSNLGVYTYELGRLTGRVYAFEPNHDLARLLDSLALPGTVVSEVALSSVDGQGELAIPRHGAGHGTASMRAAATRWSDAAHVAVRTARLDSLGLPVPVAFIKIDVEGHEEEVLDGATETIARDRPTLLIEIEENHNAGALDRITARLGELGYRASFMRAGSWHTIEDFDMALDVDPGVDWAQPRRRVPYVNNFLFQCDARRAENL